MSIVGGVDIHRKQLTFDGVDEQNGKWERGRIAPADRERPAGRLTGSTGRPRWRSRSRVAQAGGTWPSLPECYIPPAQVLERRALLELYQDLRGQHTAWVQRIQAVCLHEGATAPGQAGIVRGDRARLTQIVDEQLTVFGRLPVPAGLHPVRTLWDGDHGCRLPGR